MFIELNCVGLSTPASNHNDFYRCVIFLTLPICSDANICISVGWRHMFSLDTKWLCECRHIFLVKGPEKHRVPWAPRMPEKAGGISRPFHWITFGLAWEGIWRRRGWGREWWNGNPKAPVSCGRPPARTFSERKAFPVLPWLSPLPASSQAAPLRPRIEAI